MIAEIIFDLYCVLLRTYSRPKRNSMLIQNFGEQTKCIMGKMEMANRRKCSIFACEHIHISDNFQFCSRVIRPLKTENINR